MFLNIGWIIIKIIRWKFLIVTRRLLKGKVISRRAIKKYVIVMWSKNKLLFSY